MDIQPYLGKQESEYRDCQLGEHVVKSLMKPYLGRGYNITTDNFFTSLRKLRYLKQNNTTIVGTIRNNRRELCDAHTERGRELYKTRFFTDNEGAFLASYHRKANKTVILLSSMHNQPSIDNTQKKKRNTMFFISTTKTRWAWK